MGPSSGSRIHRYVSMMLLLINVPSRSKTASTPSDSAEPGAPVGRPAKKATAAKKLTAAQAAKLTPAELQQAVTDGRVTPRVATQAGNLMEQALRDRHAQIAG